jgi:Flp pilus assembly pilin Flp
MTALIKNFAKSESGAVTVDWVVLTAAIVGLGLAVMAVVSGGVEDLAGDIDTQLTGMGIDTTFDDSGALQSN